MGLVTLAAMQTEVASSIQRTTAVLGLPRLTQWINWSLQEVAYAFKFRELEALDTSVSTVQGQSAYSVPADWRMWHELGIRLYDTKYNYGKLIPESREQYLMKLNDIDVSSQGRPEYYHHYGAQLFLRPFPNAVYTMHRHYWKKLTPLAAAGDLSPLKDEWDEIIVLMSIAKALRSFGEYARYLDVKNDYLGQIRSRLMEEDLEQFPEGGIMPYPQSQGELETGIGG